jgi:parallel beta-helix repeat protein
MRLIALLALAVSAYGATYYVSGTGSDSNSGLSESAAFRTIQTAANKTLPGDVVYVMNGVYTTCAGCNLLDITRTGTADAWVAYLAYPGHQPRISAGTAWNAIEVHGGASYIEISGFHLQGNRLNVTLAQCTAQAQQTTPDPACNGNGISVDGRQDGANKPHHILIAGNEIYDFPGGGIGTAEADYVTIEDNFVHENAWYSRYGNSGISVYESWNYDSGPAPHTIVQRNRAFDNRSLVPYGNTGQPTDGDGIIIDTSRNNQPGSDNIGAYTGGFLVENNLAVNNGGAGLLAYQSDNITFLNNTVYGNGLVVKYADVFVNQSGSVNVWNNVVESAATGTAANVYGSAGVQFDYNMYWNGPVRQRK